MCGIAGFITSKLDLSLESEILKMTDTMISRGPDGNGFWCDYVNRVALGHRRLSIIDLSENGKQPMFSYSGRFVISFNGEIYNYKELKNILLNVSNEIEFYSDSDTEVLVNAFEILGVKKTLSVVRGMFSISLLDRCENKLYLIRDRMGEKPLYYGFYEGEFIFASTLDAIIAHTGKLRILPNSVLQYLCYGCIPAPLSIYSDFFKVLPGEIIEIDVNNIKLIKKEKYWNIEQISNNTDKLNISEDEASHELERLLTKSIEEQMVADVPVGAYLSGGIDSSLIVAIMKKISSHQVKTFTIGIKDQPYDEAPWAKKVANSLNVDHKIKYFSKEELLEIMLEMGETFSEPFADISQVPTYMVSRLAKSDVTVTLSGDGGDELFGGYSHYQLYPEIWNRVQFSSKYNIFNYTLAKLLLTLPRNRFTDRCTDFVNKCKSDSLEMLYKSISESCSCGDTIVYGANLNGIKNDDTPLQKYSNVKHDDLDNLMIMDQLQYLPDDILVKVDCTGMAVSLENRIPLLDKRIVEFAWSLPSNMKISNGISKKLMRNVLYKYVPQNIIDRPKQGFAFPALGWLLSNNEMHTWIRKLYLSRMTNSIINKRVSDQLWNAYEKNKTGQHIIWNLVMLLIWADKRNINL